MTSPMSSGSHRKALPVSLTPHSISVDDDLEDGAKQIMEKMKTENVGQLNPELLQQYSIADHEAGFEQALRSCSTISSGGIISVKSNRDKAVKNNKTADSKKRQGKATCKRHPSK